MTCTPCAVPDIRMPDLPVATPRNVGALEADDRPLSIRLASTGAVVVVPDPLRFIAAYESRAGAMLSAARPDGQQPTTADMICVWRGALADAGIEHDGLSDTSVAAVCRRINQWAAELGKDSAPGSI